MRCCIVLSTANPLHHRIRRSLDSAAKRRRSALEWVLDQYQVSTDKRSGIVNDPNRADDPEYIVRLIGQVIGVSLETMKIVKSLPPLVADSIPL
jgi:hypothetical protein